MNHINLFLGVKSPLISSFIDFVILKSIGVIEVALLLEWELMTLGDGSVILIIIKSFAEFLTFFVLNYI